VGLFRSFSGTFLVSSAWHCMLPKVSYELSMTYG
jgi:hypothetical protein